MIVKFVNFFVVTANTCDILFINLANRIVNNHFEGDALGTKWIIELTFGKTVDITNE